MIRSHRRRHLWIFTTLAVLLPLVLVAAIGVERRAPIVDRVPRVLNQPSLRTWTAIAGTEAELVDLHIHLRLLASDSLRSRLGIELTLTEALREPDAAVYWTARTDAAPDQLPGDAVFLGTIGNPGAQRLELPPQALATHVSLVLYSVAHGTVLGALAISEPRSGPSDE
ncbi:MAG: hypothetical protein E4H37_07865 [Gemmatimonadales bacterium]|nr:MAG: hypothetical protein E4H37_07865 [Gemmatimonadales bacterium]